MKLKKILPILLLALLVMFAFGEDFLGSSGDSLTEAVQTVIQIDPNTQELEAPSNQKAESTDAKSAEAAEEPDSEEAKNGNAEALAELDANGVYSSKDDVALYLHIYGHLPNNYVTKNEARAAGWNGGGLEKYLPGKCIGGDRFGNKEGLLPSAPGRTWTECDVNTLGESKRGVERIVFSNDGLIYYTNDHYESFELLYEADS